MLLRNLLVAVCLATVTTACTSPEDDTDIVVPDPDPDPAPDPDPDDPDPDPEPDPDPQPDPLAYGQECDSGAQCEGGLCLAQLCSRFCSLADSVNPCQDVEAFCVPLSSGDFGCYGWIDTGFDGDDEELSIGDSKTRSAQTLGDADLFYLDYWHAGEFLVTVQGDYLDLKLEFYNRLGEPIGEFDYAPDGGEESAIQTVYDPTWVWAVVRNVGTSTGPYTISVSDY